MNNNYIGGWHTWLTQLGTRAGRAPPPPDHAGSIPAILPARIFFRYVLHTYGKIIACMGSGISTLLFFQCLCESSNHSAWTSSTCKKKGAAFWVYCLSVLNGWKCCRYVEISNKVVMLFQCCFYKGQLVMAICLRLKNFMPSIKHVKEP